MNNKIYKLPKSISKTVVQKLTIIFSTKNESGFHEQNMIFKKL